MKTITFFSEKGGVGKSTFSIMLASWLHHKMGVKVALADFNLQGSRETEPAQVHQGSPRSGYPAFG